MMALSGGGKEVCRRGWLEDADVVESMDALRRLIAGAEDGISDCRRFEDCGSCVLEGYGGDTWENKLCAYGGDAIARPCW
jgi:hypothetical protein